MGVKFLLPGYLVFFNTPSALAYMAFVLFSAPCIGTIGAMKRELGSTKNVLLAVGFQTLLAWVVAVFNIWCRNIDRR